MIHHRIPHIPILTSESVQSKTPEYQLHDVENDKQKQQFFSLHIVVTWIFTVSDVSSNSYNLIYQHYDHTSTPAESYSLFDVTSNPRKSCNNVNPQSDPANNQSKYTYNHHKGSVGRIPSEQEKHQDPNNISRGIGISLNPEERTEKNQKAHYDYCQYIYQNESVRDSVACAYVALTNPHKGNHQHDASQYHADWQKHEEEGFAETLPTSEADVWDQTDEEQGYAADQKDGVECGRTFYRVELDHNDSSYDSQGQLYKSQKYVEGFGPWFRKIDLHVVISILIYIISYCQNHQNCHLIPNIS